MGNVITPSHVPHHLSSHRVLLIQTQWPARSLLKADLEERGCDVLADDSIDRAVERCLAHGFRPDIVVLDVVNLETDQDKIDQLQFLRGSAPLLVLSSNQPVAGPLTNLLASETLRRPFSIGNVGDIVLALARSEWL